MEGQLILDRYRPLAQLGEGGFATVVLAWDTRMQRRVAIKRLPLPVDGRGVVQRPPGLSEARTAAMLNHPAIVTVFDFDTDADEAFIVMEHIDGVSLDQLLDDTEGPLTLDETAAVVESVSSALSFAHDNGVLHLDIKPSNVLVTRDGRVKVTDFGMAELSSLSGHDSAWGGTPGYMPLEQLTGMPVSARTDEWALAALVFELLTADNPFAEDTVDAATRKLQSHEPPAVTEYEPELPAALDDILLAALDDDPHERYTSVAAFTDALVPLLGDPDAGRDSLAKLTGEYAEADDDTGPGLESVGMWDRLGGRLGFALLRVVAAAESGWLAWAGLTPFGLEIPALLGATGLVALTGALAPSLGIGLGLGCLIAGVFQAGAPVVASVISLAGILWWWLLGRRSAGAAVLPLAAPVLSAARLGPAQPLLSGFALTPGKAAVTGLLGGLLAFLAAAVSGSEAPYLNVWMPYAFDMHQADFAMNGIRLAAMSLPTYVALAGWPAAAVAMSVACGRATRLAALFGAVVGTALLGGAYWLANILAVMLYGSGQWFGNETMIALVASLILALFVAMLGAPVRAEKDELPLERAAYKD